MNTGWLKWKVTQVYNLNHIFCSLTTIFYILMDKVVVHVYGQEA